MSPQAEATTADIPRDSESTRSTRGQSARINQMENQAVEKQHEMEARVKAIAETYPLGEWDTANFFSKWSYYLANRMLSIGEKRELVFDDLMQIPRDVHAESMVESLRYHYTNSRSWWFVPRLMVAQFKVYAWNWFHIILWTLIENTTRIALPIILIWLLRALQNNDGNDAYLWAGVISILSIVQALAHHVLFYYSMFVGWAWKNATTALVYDGLFRLDSSSIDRGAGKLVNLISNDVSRFEEATVFMAFFWESVYEVILITLILVYILDYPSALAGVGATMIFVPLLLYFAQLFAAIRSSTARATDTRVRHIAEIIDGITSVKSYAWETPFFLSITGLRMKECSHIKNSQTLRAINQGIMFCIPSVANLVSFGVYWGVGGELDSSKVFATISLFQALRVTLGRQWTRAVETGSEAIASCDRIEGFLAPLYPHPKDVVSNGNDSTSKEQHVYRSLHKKQQEDKSLVVEMKDSSFYYGTDASLTVLKNLDFSVRRGEICIVVGPVGAGKSSLISAILGELSVTEGSVSQYVDPTASTAFCAQKPWIIAATVRANVCLPRGNNRADYKKPTNIDAFHYARALESALLTPDLTQWPAADLTEVGERGVSVSGGQKARISLARAVYANADLYLLDDPLSAVDAQVGKSLMIGCIRDTLRAENKAVLLVTHQLQYLPLSDKILVLSKHGEQQFFGTYAELQKREDLLDSLEMTDGVSEEDTADDVQSVLDNVSVKKAPTFDMRTLGTDADPVTMPENIMLTVESPTDKVATSEEAELAEKRAQIVTAEEKSIGDIGWSVYWKYLRSGGVTFGVLSVLFIFLSQGVLMISDYWLRWWAGSKFGPQDNASYLWIYAILVALVCIGGVLRALSWFRFSLRSSSNMHRGAFWSMMHSPMTFFVANPAGRILNRFAKDQNLVDEMLPVAFFSFIEIAAFTLGAVVLICITIPWLLIALPFLCYLFAYYRRRYMLSTREIKRIEAMTRSPIYSDFSATLDGLSTLRAYGLEKKVTHRFQRQIDENARAWFSFLMTSRWLGFRIDVETALVLVVVAFLCVVLRNTLNVGLIGFTLSYTMSITGQLQWAVRQSAEVETQMTSVERIYSYGELPAEPGYSTQLKDVMEDVNTLGLHGTQQEVMKNAKSMKAKSDAQQGNLELKDLTVRYRTDLDPVLNNLNAKIPAGRKVGVCGRTGSGKSSTLLALLRLNLISAGDIILDEQSLCNMDLETCRSFISMIPQEPHLFTGTIRFNLDPFSIYSDAEIWAALEAAHIAEYCRRSPAGLDYEVEEGGKNFSVGQRQLLSLARAILRGCKVILMDEVTASIDFQTDRLIQETIRTSPALRDATIITVAHRLRTIADSDLIIVVDRGNLVEFDAPHVLLQQENSIYRSLAMESGEFEEISQAAKRSKDYLQNNE